MLEHLPFEPRTLELEVYSACMPFSNLVAVQAFATQMDASLAKSVLESAGIDAMIQADRAGGMRDHLAWSGFGFKVLVRDEDASSAREVLEAANRYRIPEGGVVTLQEFATEAEADSAVASLAAFDIHAVIQVTAAEIPGPTLGLERFRLLVQEEQLKAAREVLRSLQRPAPG